MSVIEPFNQSVVADEVITFLGQMARPIYLIAEL